MHRPSIILDHRPNQTRSSPLILIVEDDPAILRALRDSFEFEGYRTRSAVEGRLALSLAIELQADAIVLDIMLPGVNGFEICQELRRQGNDTPIIMLTAKSREEDIILGLNLGADDYVTKPFRIRELHARVRRLLMRRHSSEGESSPDSNPLRFGPYEIDVARRDFRRSGRQISLQPKEFDLIVFLSRHPGRPFTRDQILRSVWGHDSFVSDRSVDRCITSLRKKIETDPRRPRWIKTLHRVGYRFQGDARRTS